jgi:hypothetical protein
MQVATAATANASELTMDEVVTMLQQTKPEERKEWDLQRVLKKFESLRFFQKLPPRDKSNLRIDVCRHMGSRTFGSSQYIFKEGDIGEEFYLIVQGCVSIRTKTGEIELVLPAGVSTVPTMTSTGKCVSLKTITWTGDVWRDVPAR